MSACSKDMVEREGPPDTSMKKRGVMGATPDPGEGRGPALGCLWFRAGPSPVPAASDGRGRGGLCF